MTDRTEGCPAPGENGRIARLSYKFQRLREQIRQAILNGEFQSRLPGERELGRRFNANAKTINKALCDLSSEGLVVRHIGRGTFLARRGETPIGVTQRSFRCLAPTEPGNTPYRDQMLAAIQGKIEAHGHTFVCEHVRPASNSPNLPATAWESNSRSSTDGLFCFPYEPLSVGSGHLDDATVVEAMRRQTPIVVIGAASTRTRLNQVLPDYADAGFRLGEYLFRTGCKRLMLLTALPNSGETALVRSGCRTAATRQSPDSEAGRAVTLLRVGDSEWGRALTQAATGDSTAGGPVGLICLGRPAFDAARQNSDVRHLIDAGTLRMTAILEPGDRAARDAGVTAYEVDPAAIADWAARVMIEARRGQRPVEVLMPGEVCLRCDGAPAEVNVLPRATPEVAVVRAEMAAGQARRE